jgi:GNAT superfamily N-acetyltransferase
MMSPDTKLTDELTFKPLTTAEWADLQALFAEAGPQNGCWCMYWRVKRAEFHANFGEPHKQALRKIVEAGAVPGILAYHHGRPVGWCAIAPRGEFPALDRSPTLKRVDNQPVWSIVCFFVARPYRRQGVTHALIEAAIAYARDQGAQTIEAYPLIAANTHYPAYELYTGAISTFEKIGFREVARRSARRAILRYDVHTHIGEE